MKIFNYLLLFIFIISILPNSFALYGDIPWCNIASYCDSTWEGRIPINVTASDTEYKVGQWADMRNYLAEAGYDPTDLNHSSIRIVFQDDNTYLNGAKVPMNYTNNTLYDYDWTKQIFFNSTYGTSNSSQTYFLYFGTDTTGFTDSAVATYMDIPWKTYALGSQSSSMKGGPCNPIFTGTSLGVEDTFGANCNTGSPSCAWDASWAQYSNTLSYYSIIRNVYKTQRSINTATTCQAYMRSQNLDQEIYQSTLGGTFSCGVVTGSLQDVIVENSAHGLNHRIRVGLSTCGGGTAPTSYYKLINLAQYEPDVTFLTTPQSNTQTKARMNYTEFLYDDFDDNSLETDSRWDYTSTGVTETSQRIQIVAASGTTRYFNSTTPYSGGDIDVRLVTVAGDTVPAGDSRFIIYLIDRDNYTTSVPLWYTNTTSGVYTNLELIYDSNNDLVHILEDNQPLRTVDISAFTSDALFSAKLQSWGVGSHTAYIDNANLKSNLGDTSRIFKVNNYQDAEQIPIYIKNAGDISASSVNATSTIGTLGIGSWGTISANSQETTTLNVTGVTDTGVIVPTLSGGFDTTETYSNNEEVIFYRQNITEYVTEMNITNTDVDTFTDANFTYYISNNYTSPVNVYGVSSSYGNLSNVNCYDGGAPLDTYANATHINFDGARILNGGADTYRCAFNSVKNVVTRAGRVQDTTQTTTASLDYGTAYAAEQYTIDLDTGYTIPFNSVDVNYNYTDSISGWNNTAGSGSVTIADGGNFYTNFTSNNINEVVVLNPFYNCVNTTSEDIRDVTITYNCTSRVFINDTIDFTNVLVNNTFLGGTNTTTWEGWTVDATAGTYNETYTYGVTVPGINFTDNGIINTGVNRETYEILLENPNATTLNQDFVTSTYNGFPVWYAVTAGRANFYLFDNGTDVTANVAYNVGYDATTGNFTFTVPSWSSHNFTMTVTGLSGGGGGGAAGGGGGGSALACPTGSVWDREESRCVIPSILTVEPNTPESRNINVNVGEDHQLKLTITNTNSDDAIDIEIDPKVNWIIAEPYIFTGVKKGESVTTTIKFSREFTPISRAGFVDFLVNNEYDFSIEYQQNIGQLSQIKAGIAAALGMTYEDFIEYWSTEPLGYGPSLALIFVAIIGGVTYLIYNSVKPKKLKDFTLVFILGGFGLVVAYIMLPAITFTLI